MFIKNNKLNDYKWRITQKIQGPYANPEKEIIGRKLDIYWPIDKTWYAGQVMNYLHEKHYILYNDGCRENLILNDEKWRFTLLVGGGGGDVNKKRKIKKNNINNFNILIEAANYIN